MEDIFQVAKGNNYTALPAGTVSGGLDHQGHLGFAAQSGLMPFGTDVFNNAGHGHGRGPSQGGSPNEPGDDSQSGSKN